jgi:AMIN domain
MQRFPRPVVARLLLAGLCLPVAFQSALAQSSVRAVKVLGGKDAVEIEVEASDKLVPQTQVLTGPDRLVIDFPNSTPGSQLRSQSVNVGEVKDLRVGLFQSKPPVTRIVLDLRSAQSFQVFPYGRTVMIKVSGGGSQDEAASDYAPQPTRPGLVVASYTNRAEPIRTVGEGSAQPGLTQAAPAPPRLEVTFRDGLLAIHSNKATLSEVLYAVQQRTGADVSISAGAEQEKVVVEIGPGPAPQVLAQLLNGSKFNFLILNAANDPRQLDRVILSPRPDRVVGASSPMAQNTPPEDDEAGSQPQIAMQPQPNRPPNGIAPGPPGSASQGEGKPVDDTNPDQ